MNPNHKKTILGFELAQTLEYMIKYYRCGIELCKTSKSRNIYLKELDRIKLTLKDITAIPNYSTLIFDISDCDNKAKNLMNSTLLHNQMNKYHEQRRRKASQLNGNNSNH